ncbi:probable peptidoglycan muropeptide transporter SLC46 [Periplaneta americana]|uniref:probable peptidoglycan muropeptide transporter SLC46 n=1 Tax=Periplaneta americana TaxID=6978 RepID=UPI0037E8705B
MWEEKKQPENQTQASNKSETNWRSMTLRNKWKYIMGNITVEPMLAFYIIPCVLAMLATQNLNLEKACRVNLGYSKEVCDALTARKTENYTKEETEVQQLVAGMTIWKTVVQSALPCLLMLFLGSWSDRHGRRKPCMLLPITGEFLTCIGLIMCTVFFYQLPMEVAGIVESLFPSMTGGWFTMFMAVFSYIADVTTVEMRTLRVGIVNLFVSVGVPVGMSLSGILYAKIGFYGIFSISATMYVLSFWYGFFRIQETPRQKTEQQKKEREVLKQKPCYFLRDFFDFKHIAETFRVAFKEGKNNRKMRVIMLMVACMVIIGPMHGEMAVMYLFTRYRFHWDEVSFSVFSTYGMVTNLFGTMVSVCVFSHILKIDDALIGVMSCMSKILASFVYAFSTTDWQIYMAPLVEILNGTSFIAMRSIASKLVPTDEIGKVNSLFGVCEALMPLVYGPMYSAVYAATMHTVPGAFFLLGGGLTAPAVLIFIWMYFQHKKEAAAKALEARNLEAANQEVKNSSIALEHTNQKQQNGGVENKAYVAEDERDGKD